MNNLERIMAGWLGHGWLLLLGFTVAALWVAALRKPFRHLFGAECAFQLWLLPPLAMLASQLPHAAAARFTTFPSVVYMITSAGWGLPTHAGALAGMGWRTAIVLVWFAGVLASLVLAARTQWRYQRHLLGATVIVGLPSRWPVWRAAHADIGPALVGAWRSRIVLPADFERRYDTAEQALILSHETTHAHRRDGWWCLLARIVAALLWFHPLSWWALSAFRHDQELACDAAVLRQHRGQRRRYAHAMLKTQSALFVLPVGCPWSPRHPLTERIAMLTLPLQSRVRRNTGVIAGLVLATMMTCSVYAASKPSGAAAHADTSARSHLVSQQAKNESARAVAIAIAAKAGLTLVNPESLDNRLVTLSFKQMPAERAMRLIADVDGKKAVFEGNRVRFEAK